jgi:hypothetical protein
MSKKIVIDAERYASASIERDDFGGKLIQNESVTFNYDCLIPLSPRHVGRGARRSVHARSWNGSEMMDPAH